MTVEEYNICVDDFSDGLFRFILKNIKDKDKANDIVQDTYEKLWLRVDEVAFSKAKSYLFSSGYHTLIDLIRREKKQTNLRDVLESEYANSNQYTDLQDVLNEALEKLSEIQRSVILLRDYEGYSYDEIAEITGLNNSQVKVYIYRARLFLKNYIGNLEVVI
jgi:RNA polymerase sigma-70 factor (ECF subfamily)